MPRPKRTVRASGVARSLGAGPENLIRCLCCGRWLPRDAIAHIGRKAYPKHPEPGEKRVPSAFCGECWHSGAVWSDAWVADIEREERYGLT